MGMMIEPIRYGQHLLAIDASGLLVTKDSIGIDCTSAGYVDGLSLSGSEPANTRRRVVFRVDGVWGTLRNGGAVFLPLDEQNFTTDSLLTEGNTVAELEVLTSIPCFVGKKIGVAIALQADDPAGEMPTLGLSVKTRVATLQKIKTELSPLFDLGQGAQIVKLEAQTSVASGGTAVVEAQITKPDGTLSDWGTLSSFTGLKANCVQFRAVLTAPTPGVSSAKVERAAVSFRSGGGGLVSGTGTAEIVSKTYDWYMGVRQCRMTIRHARLQEAKIRGYVAFRDQPSVVKGERLGVGNGETQTFQLKHPKGVKYDSVRIYFDGQRIYTSFEVNTEVGRATYLAPDGAVVTADYEYGWTAEIWHEMENAGTIPTLDYDRTEFRFILPRDETARSICAVKIAMEMTDGHIDAEDVGIGRDKLQSYPLSHIVKDGKIQVYADGVELAKANWTLSDDAKAVRAIAPAGAQVAVSYDWISETPVVNQFVAVFAE